MNYTTTSRDVKALFKSTVKSGLPTWLCDHVEKQMAYAHHKWEASRDVKQDKDLREHSYQRAVMLLIGLQDMLTAFFFHARVEGVVKPRNSTGIPPGYYPVDIPRTEWLDPKPQHRGERVLWPDGRSRTYAPEEGETVKVLRRVGSKP